MSSAAQRVPTFDDLYQAIIALPHGITGEILERGVIHTMGRPGGPHRFTAYNIRRSLQAEDGAGGGTGWWLETEAEVRLLVERLGVPDLSGWRLRENDAVPPAFMFDPIDRRPDWCCEVLSPSTEKIDREIKTPLYAAAGVAWIWLVDPVARRIEVMQSTDGVAALVEIVEGDETRPIPPFASAVTTAQWWLPKSET
jgi:Uma2 family endonuclease